MGAIYFAIGWHASWDWWQSSVSGFTEVEKSDFGNAYLHLSQNGPVLFVGKAPAIESGLLFLLIVVVVIAILIDEAHYTGHHIAWHAKLESDGKIKTEA